MTNSPSEPSADEIKRRMEQLGEEEDRGAGNEDPDPATAENPPTDRSEGDRTRDQR